MGWYEVPLQGDNHKVWLCLGVLQQGVHQNLSPSRLHTKPNQILPQGLALSSTAAGSSPEPVPVPPAYQTKSDSTTRSGSVLVYCSIGVHQNLSPSRLHNKPNQILPQGLALSCTSAGSSQNVSPLRLHTKPNQILPRGLALSCTAAGSSPEPVPAPLAHQTKSDSTTRSGSVLYCSGEFTRTCPRPACTPNQIRFYHEV